MQGFRTIIFNVVMALVMFLVQKYKLDLGDVDIQSLVTEIVSFILIFGNVLLRFISKTPIFQKAKKELENQSGKATISILIVLSLLGPVFLSIGCAEKPIIGIQLVSKEQQYLAARIELNLLMEKYFQEQDKIPVDIRAKATLAFETADRALDAWEYRLDGALDVSEYVKLWNDSKDTILEILSEVK